MRRCITVALLVALVTLGVAAPVAAHEAHEARADCGQRINAQYMACVHRTHGHSQFLDGRGTPAHTWARYQAEARQLRNYLLAIYVANVRQNLVDHWSGVAGCESGGNWAINTGNGYYGGLQFNLGTWQAYGGAGMPHQQPAWYQASIADKIRVQSGLHHWPHCGRYYG